MDLKNMNSTFFPCPHAHSSDFQRMLSDQSQTNRQLPSNSRETSSQKKIGDVTAPTFQDYTNTPQITFTKKGKIGILSKAKPITQLVFEGGGCKGAVYGQVLEILDRNLNLCQSLEEVAGTSAGAGIAFLIAAGILPKEINDYLSTAKLSEKLYGGPVQNLELKSLKLSQKRINNKWRSNGLFTGNNMTQDMLKMTQKSASDFYKSIKNQQEKIAQIMDDERAFNFIERAKEGFQGGVTFYDLRLLRRLDPRFKELHVTGFHREAEEGILFNADKTPDECCHAAVRASMSLPVVFQPVLMNGKTITDGGEVSNLPSEVFTERKEYNPEKILALVFNRNGAAKKILHSPPQELSSPFKKPFESLQVKISHHLKPLQQKINSFANWIMELIDRLCIWLNSFKLSIGEKSRTETSTPSIDKAGPDLSVEKVNKTGKWYGPKMGYLHRFLLAEKEIPIRRSARKKVHQLGPSILVVPHDGLKTLDFLASPKKIAIAKLAASQSAEEYAELRKVMASHRTYESREEAIAALSEAEKVALWESTRHQAEELLLQISNEKEEVEQFDRFRNLLQKMISSTEKDLPSAFELLQFLALSKLGNVRVTAADANLGNSSSRP